MKKSIFKSWYMITTVSIALVFFVGFILTSFGNIDRWFADVMGEWIKNDFMKFWVVFYNEMGFTALFLVCSISFVVLIESFFIRYKENKKIYNFIYVGHVLTFAFFLNYNLNRLIGVINENTGWGPGIDVEYLTDNTFKIISRISIFIIEASLLISFILLMRLKISKSSILLENRVWILAISSILFGIISFFSINYLLKQTFGRPYYLNVKFERYIGKVHLDETGFAVDIDLTPEVKKLEPQHPDLKQQILQSYNESNYWTQADGYYKWYEVNGNWFQNLQYWTNLRWLTWWIKFDHEYKQPLCWLNQDFPSGHTVSGFTGIYYALFANALIKDERKRKITTNTLFSIWLFSEILMVNLLVVARTHYISDTWFSFAYCTFALIVSLKISNVTSSKIVLKKRNKKREDNFFEIIDNKIFIFFQEDNKIFVSNFKSKKWEKKVDKYLGIEQIEKLKVINQSQQSE
ncbi:phosphatase PAP2 family protein [Spiroplasma endosymbiont of Panorpa germanica]|uniref:phosphatase PAP2 family protein n=1 Tax=Spiroplasma endosymbiont of Panorpa germanica TaxID=3066314 RepID=UPI0030D06638